VSVPTFHFYISEKEIIINTLKTAIHSNITENIIFYLTENVLRPHYRDQSVNIIQGNNCFFSEFYETDCDIVAERPEQWRHKGRPLLCSCRKTRLHGNGYTQNNRVSVEDYFLSFPPPSLYSDHELHYLFSRECEDKFGIIG
jgi:hypothetical protein